MTELVAYLISGIALGSSFALIGSGIVGLSAGEVVYDGSPAGVTADVIRRIYPGLDDPNILDAASRIHERRTRVADPEALKVREGGLT